MSINRAACVNALAAAIAINSTDCRDSSSQPEDTTIQYPHGNGVVTKGPGNETTTEKRAAAYLKGEPNLKGESGQEFRCHDYSSNPMIGKVLAKDVDESRSKIEALTRCAPAAEKTPKCTVDVPFDKNGNPITSIWC